MLLCRSLTARMRTPSARGAACSMLSTLKFDHGRLDKKWQHHWEENQTFKAPEVPSDKKKYILDMFPYPSGSGLHVGHPEGYTATDIVSRYWRMRGYDVLHPMGWDAFGLPAEQHAIATGEHPEQTTLRNIQTFKRQLKSLGFSYDWNRELATTDLEYVKWTQWIFLQLFKSDLAYQSSISVNWCPKLGTVLANEEVINGLSERGGHPVVRRPLRQWMLRITAYAEALEKDLNGLSWPEGTMQAQKRWIGRSQGAIVRFKITGGDDDCCIEAYTTRPDTLLGVTYLVLAPEHEFVTKVVREGGSKDVEEYVASSTSKSDVARMATKEKTGVYLGCTAVHPISGEEIPIWCADYVLSSYGTGAVMAVPAHDSRDYEFASVFGLPVKKVVSPSNDVGVTELPYLHEGIVCNSGVYDGMESARCGSEIVEKLSSSGEGEAKEMYKLHDWVFSRQRYWGEPIPIYYPVEFTNSAGEVISPADAIDPKDPNCLHRICYETPIAVEESDLPLELPAVEDFSPRSDPQGCLAQALDWRYFKKPDGCWYARETSTMPQWAGSCWYYLRFTDPKNTSALFGDAGNKWLPVDLYVGGQEHAVLHLLYARFWHKVLHSIGVVDDKEPFPRLVHQGMILGPDGEKMSKSRGNVINPDTVVNEVGADALRLYEMFMGPLEAVKPWQMEQVSGVVRFRDKVYSLVLKNTMETGKGGAGGKKQRVSDDDIVREMHKTIKKVTADVENLNFNTAISALMVYTNLLTNNYKHGETPEACLHNLVLLVSPFAPHLGEECWELLGHKKSLAYHQWPDFDEAWCVDESCTVSVQVNGKLRGTIDISKDALEKDILELAADKVSKYLSGFDVKKQIYVKHKVVNIVLGPKKV